MRYFSHGVEIKRVQITFKFNIVDRNGDVIRNHIVKIQPPENTTNVSPDTIISIQLDDKVQTVNTNGLLSITDELKNEIPGIVMYDENSRTIMFTPKKLFPLGSKIIVVINATCLKNQTGSMLMDLSWSFTTKVLTPVFVQFKTTDALNEIKQIQLLRNTNALFAELVGKIITKLSIDSIFGIKLLDSNIIVEDDVDIFNLRENDVLLINTIKS